MELKIHKRNKSRYIIAEEVLCGRWAQHGQTSYQWRKVNCENCLKYADKYFIREEWIMRGIVPGVERYDEKDTPSNTVYGLSNVQRWIKDWLETWKENAEDNDYRFLKFRTDYKTFATCWIKKYKDATDTFKLKVIKAKEKKSFNKRSKRKNGK